MCARILARSSFRSGSTTRITASCLHNKAVCRPVSSTSHLLTSVLTMFDCKDALNANIPFSDRDGTLDMLFATCASVSSSTGIGSTCSINIAYNKQLPLCPQGASSVQKGKRVCRLPEELCTADPDFRFDMSVRDDNPVRHSHSQHTRLLVLTPWRRTLSGSQCLKCSQQAVPLRLSSSCSIRRRIPLFQ